MSEKLYVSAFSAATILWNTHLGVSPYLQEADGNSISAYTDHAIDDSFTFADTAITDFATITSIKLKGLTRCNIDTNTVELLLTGSSGGAWSATTYFSGDGTNDFVPTESVDLKATINSLARINECAMLAKKHNGGGAGTLILKQVYLEITVAAAIKENVMDGLVQA